MNHDQLLEEFKAIYSQKYELSDTKPIGEGQYAYVYKAKDIDRDIDVAIKIYKEGNTPEGAERGWSITTRIAHPQIALTYTIERILGSDGNLYKAVISKYIDGKTVKALSKELALTDEDNKRSLVNYQVFSVLPSVLNILAHCHANGAGHGDLHADNVMVTYSETYGKRIFIAILIDFDNASISNGVFLGTEKEKIEKDGRTFFNEIYGVGTYLLDGWEHQAVVSSIKASYSTIKDLKIAFDTILQYCRLLKENSLSTIKVAQILNSLLSQALAGFSAGATINCIREISIIANRLAEFNAAYKMINDAIKKGPEVEVTITEISGKESNFFDGLFLKKS